MATAPMMKYPMPMKKNPAKGDGDGDERPMGKTMSKKSMGKSCPKR